MVHEQAVTALDALAGALPSKVYATTLAPAPRSGERSGRWLVLWGPYSRLYWAFPTFAAPPGTILSAPGPRELLPLIHQAELTAHTSQVMAPARRP